MQKRHFNLVVAAIVIIMGMDLIDTSVMNNILPKMADSLDTTPVHLKMGISIYMIVMGIFLPASSWLAEKISYRNTLIFAASGFGIFSFLSGMASSDIELFIFRGMQGLFAAFSAPVAALAYLKFSENMLEGTASLSNYTLIMAIAGQILGGVFASLSPESWRLAFFMQTPFAIFAVVILFKYFPTETLIGGNKKLDFWGLALLGLSIAALFILSETLLKEVSLSVKFSLAAFVCICLSIYAFIYKQIKDPIIDFSVFKNKEFSVSFMSSFICKITTYWVFFAWPVVLYELSHLNTIYISIMSVFLMFGTIISKQITKKLVYKYSYKVCMISGLFGIAVVMVISIIFDIYYSYVGFCLMAMIYGFVLGIYQTSSNAVIYSVVDATKLDSVNTIKNSGNMIASSFALTVFTLTYDFYYLYATDHHWRKIFAQAYFGVVVTTAIIQIIMIIWIAFSMSNIKEQS